LEEESREMVSVKFGGISICQIFECYGDMYINYDYPKVCICVKTGEYTAEELNGVSFLMNKNNLVFINAKV